MAATGCCDAAEGGPDGADVLPRRLRDFAERLTVTPWRTGPDDLERLLEDGWDDAAIIQVIGVISGQNADSRLRFGLGAAALARSGRGID